MGAPNRKLEDQQPADGNHGRPIAFTVVPS